MSPRSGLDLKVFADPDRPLGLCDDVADTKPADEAGCIVCWAHTGSFGSIQLVWLLVFMGVARIHLSSARVLCGYLVPAPYCPRRWCWCQTAPYTRRRESWLLTKYSFSLVREPAAAQLPTYGLGLLSCLPPALTLAKSDTVAKPTALS